MPFVPNKEAGRDWLSGFMRRRQDLSIRKPQATSLSRATSFNKHNDDSFFDNVDVELHLREAHWLQSALQYLPQGRLFHHILSFQEFILRNISSVVPLLVLLDQPISLAGYVRQRSVDFASSFVTDRQ
ncbi:hypothetical protein DAPPUDRAFT_117451 [Daphnia pulex]|uniref:HTH CENPB-type domain-containing protein n=1 Tax=Daphnia pulex TaxID=6669 RepID=E9HSP6_DAPPU|nr:hypothetical protein DAPPUDRAFT_117451 [Daphnia pulex]|eukprot:EFX65239.1 hypothetical protein DAPPUDRAFT_117451 [Daphnia pulex]